MKSAPWLWILVIALSCTVACGLGRQRIKPGPAEPPITGDAGPLLDANADTAPLDRQMPQPDLTKPPTERLPPRAEPPTPDKPAKPWCGNGICEAANNETPALCPKDCGPPAPRCGDTTCDPNETHQSCPQDCPPPKPRCGDGKCEGNETPQNCPKDCQTAPRCGDGKCDSSESSQSCPKDCVVNKCGNGVCDPGEKPGCPQDCCTALTAERYINNEGKNKEFTSKFYPTKDRNNEYIDMFFRSGDLGLHTYGAGKNADLYTCRQCMLVVRNKKNFYPVKGTINIKAGSQPLKKRLFAELSQLTLIEIKISSTYHSIPVKGGECITLAPATINVK